MDHDERVAEIDRKCRMAGCDEKKAKRHAQMFIYETWDVHPPDDFRAWYKDHGPGPDTHGKPANPISGWNADAVRQEFYRIKSGEL